MSPPTRYLRFLDARTGRPTFGRVHGDAAVPLTAAPWEGGVDTPGAAPVPLSGVTFLPVSAASKVVCIGQNYAKHAAEMGKPVPAEPLLFTKPSTALEAHGGAILLPPASQEVHHEAELALVIGERLTRADPAAAARAIWGLTCFNDVTARDVQRREVQHTRAKGYDTFAPSGPFFVRAAELAPDLERVDLRVVCRVNGQVRQDGRTSDMVHSPARLVAFISHVMTLLPGDLVSTGTPSGVGRLDAGDVVEVEVEGIGTLRNSVQRAP